MECLVWLEPLHLYWSSAIPNNVKRAGCFLEVRIRRVAVSKFCFEDQMMPYVCIHCRRGLKRSANYSPQANLMGRQFRSKSFLAQRHAPSFLYCPWLLSHTRREAMAIETEWPAKPKVFIFWPFARDVCLTPNCYMLAYSKNNYSNCNYSNDNNVIIFTTLKNT